MFAPLGLFKDVACPEGSRCGQLNCIFGHQETNVEAPQQAPVLDPTLVGDSEPANKRRKLAHDEQYTNKKPHTVVQPEKRKEQGRHDVQPVVSREISDLPSAHTKVSPPPVKAVEKRKKPVPSPAPVKPPDTAPSSLKRKAPKESLNPRLLKKAPAPHSTRSSILVKLHSVMKALNEKVVKLKDPQKASLVLTSDELIVMALDEEQKIANDNPSVYGNVIRLRIVKLQRMTVEDWEKEVLAHLNLRYYKIEPLKEPKQVQKFATDLTEDEEIAIARMLRTELRGKEQFGYITKIPTEADVTEAKKGIEAAQGWEKCDRCAGRFQVFPGRREDGTLATGGRCTYHPGKIIRPPKKAIDHITGQAEAYFPCCNETVGTSAGCTKAEHHVFKTSDPKRLAAVLEFEETPIREETTEPRKPVTFDCEMGYTTLGMEMVRLTALSWPKGERLLDVLVKPIGEILDLNSKFSGVFPEHYTNAVPYSKEQLLKTAVSEPEPEDGEIEPPPPMQVVDSPAAARALLFELIDPDTPLIGHAIDNDLNVVRIIHPTVIDTVLLFPHPRGLPVRYSLKHLTKLHLDRDIQMGGDKGHDSKEDALATGDLVRLKVAEKAKVLKRAGWTIKSNNT